MIIDLGLETARRLSVGLVLAATLISCGKDDASDSVSDAVLAAELIGTWTGNCVSDEDGTWEREITEFKANQLFVGRYTTYKDSGCDTSTFSMNIDGSVKLGTSYGAGKKIDYIPSNIEITIDDDLMLAAMNSSEQCGANYFTKGVAKSISKGDCKASYDSLFDTGYTIYAIESGYLSEGKLDDTNDGSSDAKRPKTLEDDKLKKS